MDVFNFLKGFPNVFIPVFVAIDVFALLPLFIYYTSGLSEQEIKKVISQSISTALFVSVGFVAVGEVIFRLIGITIDDFKIAGGLVLLVIAILEIVQSDTKGSRKAHLQAVGIVPIGVPMIVGPALLTTLIILLEHFGVWITLSSLLLNLLIVWILFRNAVRIVKLIGKNGILAISKLMAILLASIAIMMIRVGIENTLK